MFKTTALDNVANAYVDKDVGASVPGTRIEADDQNIKQDELVAPVESSGQALDATGVKRNQVARAMFLNGVGSQSMIDSGTANVKVLTPVTGASGYIFAETYAQLTGAVFLFKNSVTNTGGGAWIDCGQTIGTRLGVKPFTKTGGVAFAASELVANEYYEAIYDLTNDRFELPINSMLVSDLAYSGAWNGVTGKAPSQNALYDIISTLSDIPSGEKILFYKNTAVVGYSLLNTLDDKVVYVTKGSAAGGQTGGTVHSSGTWTQPNHDHVVNDHDHEIPAGSMSARTGVESEYCFDACSPGTLHTYNMFTESGGAGNTGSGATVNTWRSAAYNFTMQQRN